MKKILFLFFSLCTVVASAFAQNYADSIRAFPSAEGYGAWVTGGRGGRVVYVTHTKDITDVNDPKYVGSIRWALTQPGSDPVTVMFKCGGVIDMQRANPNSKTEFKTSRSNMTIAGQTALGDGIVIKGFGMGFSGKNVILRYLRFRPGDIYHDEQSCLWYENSSDFIIDHCSFSWAAEESMTVYDNERTTVQYCLVTESLYNTGHGKGPRGYGAQWGGKTATYHHNMLAHHTRRMPRQNGSRSESGPNKDGGVVIYDYVNNVHYNWADASAYYGFDANRVGNRVDANIVNNYYIPGPALGIGGQYYVRPDGNKSLDDKSCSTCPGELAKIWLGGNIMQGNTNVTTNQYAGLSPNQGTANDYKVAAAHIIPEYAMVNAQTAEVARDSVFSAYSGVGAVLPRRDGIDARVIDEAKGKTTNFGRQGIIDNYLDTKPVGAIGWDAWGSYYAEVDSSHAPLDSDGDGLPDWWEDAEGLNKSSAADGNARGADKYTHLERYLNGESSFSLRPNGEGKFDQHLRWPQVLPDNLNAAATRLGATSTSGLPVTFRSADPGIVTVTDGNLLTVVGAGSTTLTAEVAATAEYSAAAITRTITIKENQVITWAQTLTGTFGDTLTLTAISSNDDLPLVYTPSRADVAKVIDGNRLVLQRVTTTDSVTVRQAGNAYYFDALPVSQRLTVGKAQQTITWEQDTALGYGSDIALTATASSGLTVVYTVSAAGNTSSSTVRNGKLTPTTLGAVTITARQTGGTNHEAATAVVKTFTIGKGAQALAWEQPLSLKVGETLPLTASSDRDLPVSYTSDNLSVATISGNVLTAVGEGEATVRATQAGSDVYAAAEEVVRSITVTAAGTGDGGEQPTGVGSTRQVPVQVYPNPVDDVLTLRFEEEGSYALALSDMSGRVVYQAKVSGSTHTVNVSSYASGTYLLSIENAQKQRTVVKVVVR